MKWSLKEPKTGDIIRVSIGRNIHHYGIYVSDDEVIQYGLRNDALTKKEDVFVRKTAITEFLGGEFLEVCCFSLFERIIKNSKNKTIKKARLRLGEAKYDILNNNCEHFVNECVFNKHISHEAKAYMENQK